MNVGCAVAFLDALLPFLDSDRGAHCRAHGRHLGPFFCVSFQQMLIDVGLVTFDVHAVIRSEGA